MLLSRNWCFCFFRLPIKADILKLYIRGMYPTLLVSKINVNILFLIYRFNHCNKKSSKSLSFSTCEFNVTVTIEWDS